MTFHNCETDIVLPGFSFTAARPLLKLTSTGSTPVTFFQCHVDHVGAGHSIHAEDGEIYVQQFGTAKRKRSFGYSGPASR